MQGRSRWTWTVRHLLRLFPLLVVDARTNPIVCNFFASLPPSAGPRIQNVDLEKSENLEKHRTQGFSCSSALVVRRGAPFKISVQLKGRPFNPRTDSMRIRVMLGIGMKSTVWEHHLVETVFAEPSPFLVPPGRLYVVVPVTCTQPKASPSGWNAYMDPDGPSLQNPSIFICSPASASVGCYRFQLSVFTIDGQQQCTFGKLILLCNPWCQGEQNVRVHVKLRRRTLQIFHILCIHSFVTSPVT